MYIVLDLNNIVYSNHRIIILNKGKHVYIPVKRIFPAVKLCLQTPPIDKREIGDAAFPENAEYTLLPQPPPPTRAISQ